MESILMGFSPRYFKRRKKFAAFSLIAVLIISIIGFAVIGALLQITTVSGGVGRAASANAVKYNRLQEAVEDGKAKLKEKMLALGASDPAPKYKDDGEINTLDELLVSFDLGCPTPGIVRDKELTASELGRMGIFVPSGSNAKLTVAIYDMGYDPNKIKIDPSDANLRKLHPSIQLKAGGPSSGTPTGTDGKPSGGGGTGGGQASDAGAYLVRATLDLGGEEFIMESAIMQAKDKP